MIYRDQCQVDWRQVTASPMKVILSLLPVLTLCQDESCEGLCELWHKHERCEIEDTILESWGRQWLSSSFHYVQPADADMYSIHLRIPISLQNMIQTYSGCGGLYISSHVHWTGELPVMRTK